MPKECPGRMRLERYGCYDVRTGLNRTTWYEANQTCAKTGKTLLAIDFEDENGAIKSLLKENEGIPNNYLNENNLQRSWHVRYTW